MKYRNKLFLSFTLIITISTLLAVGILYSKGRELVLNQIRSELLSIALSSSTSLDGAYIKTIKTVKDTQTEQYINLIHQLRYIRNTNRRNDIYITYVYVFKRISEENFFFIADAEEDPAKVSLLGDPYLLSKDFNPNFAFVDKEESKDQWGTWFSAYAPIYGPNESIVAYLGVDYSSVSVNSELHKLLVFSLLGFFVSCIFGFLNSNLLSRKMTTDLTLICSCVNKVKDGNLKARVYLDSKDELGALAVTINGMAQGLEEKERIKSGFSKYVSQHVLEKIIKSDAPAKLEGEKRKVTVLFSDIRNFTTLSESLSPEEVVAFLNQYFEEMIGIIFHFHGTLDKFIGDGIMAEFGVPLDDQLQEVNAIEAALTMQDSVAMLCQKWKGTRYENIKIGIGVHTGLAVVGNIGSTQRMEYTAIGDTVNVASRLESQTKEIQKNIIISHETYETIKNMPNLSFEALGQIHLKGRKEPIIAYAVARK
jgi:adenylate cyclase